MSLTDAQPAAATVAGNARVRITRAAVHPSDVLMIMGLYGYEVVPGSTLGSEGVGVVTDIGEGVRDLQIGQRVAIIPNYEQGTWAGEIEARPQNLVPIPDGVSDDEAALAGVNPLTAVGMLRAGLLQPGDWVIQNAANSAAGRAVAAVARREGLRAVHVVRRDDAVAEVSAPPEDVIVNGGASPLVDAVHTVTGGIPPRLGIEVHGGPAANHLIEALADRATLLVYGAVTHQPLQAWAPHLIFRGVSIRGFWLLNWIRSLSPEQLRDAYGVVFGLIATGDLSTPLAGVYPLADHRDAIREATRPARHGKVLFDPQA
jgi:NADPH:quinone reductase-like Zn-dependent oxidoreductase